MFSYAAYRDIIRVIQESGKMENFYTAEGKVQYVIMRHDVEFSVERAYHLAEIEAKEHFYSTYLFQLRNNAYNLLSKKNMDLLYQIHDMGHIIGFHYHTSGLENIKKIKAQIVEQISIMSYILGFQVDIFSVHRPSNEILKANIKLDHIINTYQDEYFSFVEDMSKEVPEVRYLSDARHRWNYGLLPDEKTINEVKKVQILTHPYSWSENGYDNLENFRILLQEKDEEYRATIDTECKHFREIKNQL